MKKGILIASVFAVLAAAGLSNADIKRIASKTASSFAAAVSCANSSSINVDSGTLYVDCSNNRVGIGTTGPENDLHVVAPTEAADGSICIESDQADDAADKLCLTMGADNTFDINSGGTDILTASSAGAFTFDVGGSSSLLIDDQSTNHTLIRAGASDRLRLSASAGSGAVLDLNTSAAYWEWGSVASAPTCDTIGQFYVDSSDAYCYCNGSTWNKISGAGACT